MARPDYPAPFAARTIRDGLSARAGLAAYRSAGGRTGDAKWFRLVAEARRRLAESIAETGRPLGRRPTGTEITTVSSTRHSGFWQQVEVFYRDRATGEVSSAPFVHRSDGLVTRQAAIAFALGEWEAGGAGSANQDDHEVLGATYTSTLELQIAASPPQPTVVQATMTPPAPRLADVQDQIRLAYRALAEHGEWVGLDALRDALPTLSRAEVDQALRTMARGAPDVHIIPSAQPLGVLTQRQRETGLMIGEELNVAILIERP